MYQFNVVKGLFEKKPWISLGRYFQVLWQLWDRNPRVLLITFNWQPSKADRFESGCFDKLRQTDIFDKQVQQVSSKADEGSAQLGGVKYIIGSLTTRDVQARKQKH